MTHRSNTSPHLDEVAEVVDVTVEYRERHEQRRQLGELSLPFGLARRDDRRRRRSAPRSAATTCAIRSGATSRSVATRRRSSSLLARWRVCARLLGRRLVVNDRRQDTIGDDRAEMEVASAQRAGQVARFVRRGRLERGHHDERGSRVAEEPLDLAGMLDEPLLHRLEEDEELGDVLEESRPEDSIRHLVEGLRRHREQP